MPRVALGHPRPATPEKGPEMSNDLYQWAKADGTPDWSPWASTWQHVWAERAFELLRFERGAGFVITDRAKGTHTAALPLSEVGDKLKRRLLDSPDEIFEVRSQETGFALIFRGKAEPELLGGKLLDHGYKLLGAPYVLGAAGPNAADCSGTIMFESEPFGITYGPFYTNRAQVMWDEFKSGKDGKLIIPRAKIRKGDFLVHWGGDHISTYIDDQFGGRVLDAEPHGTGAPRGWPVPYLQPGVRIRPMTDGFYCDWQHVEAVCRLVKINGSP